MNVYITYLQEVNETVKSQININYYLDIMQRKRQHKCQQSNLYIKVNSKNCFIYSFLPDFSFSSNNKHVPSVSSYSPVNVYCSSCSKGRSVSIPYKTMCHFIQVLSYNNTVCYLYICKWGIMYSYKENFFSASIN